MKKMLLRLICITVLLAVSPIKIYGTASNYAVVEQSSGRILYKCNENKRMPMASTTKIMTAILVIENLDLSQKYRVPDEAVGIEGSSIYLEHGEILSGEELLYGLMMASGNDAAYALAMLTSGSAEQFVSLMNDKARDLGMENTHFEDPCGLEYKNHYSTAYDMAILCRYALNNEKFAEVVSTKNYQISGSEEGTVRYLYNKNKILGGFEGGNGIKTGYTRVAGRCLCSSATRNGMQVICVVLNDHDWFNDSMSLMNKAFDEYSLVNITEKENFSGMINICGGKSEKCDIIIKNEIKYPIKANESIVCTYNVEKSICAPVKANQKVGEAKYYLDGTEIAKTDIVTKESVGKKIRLFGR